VNLRGSSTPSVLFTKPWPTQHFWSRRFKPSAYPRWNIENQGSRPTTRGGHPIAMIVAQKHETSVPRAMSELSRLLNYSAVACLASGFSFRHKKIAQSTASTRDSVVLFQVFALDQSSNNRDSASPRRQCRSPIPAVVFRVDFVDQ
jgi:hypothetical protein